MSEKRRQKQQRRQRRKAGGRSRSHAPGRPAGGASAREAERELAVLLDGMAEIAAADSDEPGDGLEAAQWASALVGAWQVGPLPDPEVDELFGPGLVRALEGLGTAGALAALRAMSTLGAEPYAESARGAAERLSGTGVAEPPWSDQLDPAQPVAALLMYEETFDDGVTVFVEFAAPGGESHTLGVYIDHNMGGLVKDAFVAGPLAEVRKRLISRRGRKAGIAVRELELDEARARVEDALFVLDHTFDPPVNEDVRSLRALIAARMRTLPEGGAAPGELEEVPPEERERLLADFLGSPQGIRWRGDEEAEDVVRAAIEFGAGWNHGGPLRWSPVVVEIFMTSWLARKVAREREFFERIPDVLRDWVAYAGRCRGVRSAALREAIVAVDRYREEMLETVASPAAWGPAKALAVAAHEAGVDPSDPDALDDFIGRYNDGLAA